MAKFVGDSVTIKTWDTQQQRASYAVVEILRMGFETQWNSDNECNDAVIILEVQHSDGTVEWYNAGSVLDG